MSIHCPHHKVYEFASNPENLPQWAAGLTKANLKRSGNEWITSSPMGDIKIRFIEPNSFGVIDHDVTLPSGEVVHNPLRVMKNALGSEIVFTLFRRPEMNDDEFNKDAEMVNKDLLKLKSILESRLS